MFPATPRPSPRPRLHVRAVTLAACMALTGLVVPGGTAAAAPSAAVSSSRQGAVLTNLAHLDFLGDRVTPPAQRRHTTYRLSAQPRVGVLWTYADRQDDGSYQRVGGGDYDAATNTYSQGAFNADDLSRAAVVYLRHWRQFGDTASRRAAYQLLRGLTYLQTDSGRNAGNVVLWMQPDGTLNPSPVPVELPDPSDSGPSYWLARTVWALGTGYAAFQHENPAFAHFLRARLDLAIAALQREVLDKYGDYQVVDGVLVPAWLVVDGADASAEAALGLAAYVRAGGTPAARHSLRQLAKGIAAMGAGDARHWPYGAVLPWALSRSDWHAWASQMPAALARAADALDAPGLLDAAVTDAAVFTPQMLTATGPDNGWLPTPGDGTQIAYGADSRVRSLLQVARTADRPGLRRLGGIAAGWFFGANPAGQPVYDPATGVTYDGVSADGVINTNSGAESTIHGLLTMLALDARPRVARLARASAHIVRRHGQELIEAEAATLGGDASVVHPDSAWTGESLWSNGEYVRMGAGSTATWQVPSDQRRRLVQPVADLVEDPAAGVTTFTSGDRTLGRLHYGSGGPQGVSPAAGALLPVTLRRPLPGAATEIDATTADGSGSLDALLLQPLVSRLVLSGGGHGTAVLHSVARRTWTVRVSVPGAADATVTVCDREGITRFRSVHRGDGSLRVRVLPGGFTLVVR